MTGGLRVADPVLPDDSIDLTQDVKVLPVHGRSLHDPCPGLNSAQWAQFAMLTDNQPVWFFVRERDAVLMGIEQFTILARLAGRLLDTTGEGR